MKKVLSVIIYPIILFIVEWLLILLFSIIFNNTTSLTVGTDDYIVELSKFLSNNKLLISVLSLVILLPFLYKKVDKPKNKTSNIPLLIIIGVLFSLGFNLLLYGLNIIFNFTNVFDAADTNIVVTIVSVGIIGPILEELVFRGITYNRLKLVTSKKTAMIVTGLLFGIFHGNINQFIYVFIFNVLLIYSYEDEKNILAPIIMHISANVGTIILLIFIQKLNICYSLLLFIIFAIILLIILYKSRNIVNSNNVNEN